MWEVYYNQDQEPVQPEDYCLLAIAAAELAEESISAQEIERAGNRVPLLDWKLLDAKPDALTGDNALAREWLVKRAEYAAHDIGRAAFSGRIKFACRAKAGGPLEQVPSAHWGIDDFWHRIAASAYNPEQPFGLEAEPTHWLFVAEEGWQSLIDEVLKARGKPLKYNWKASQPGSGGEPPPPAPSRLNFLPAGEVGPVIEIEQAITLALHGRPSADTTLYWNENRDDVVLIPWAGTIEAAQRAVQVSVVGTAKLLRALREAYLTAIVQHPASGLFLKIPRYYWFPRDLVSMENFALQPVEGSTGFDPCMVGQPILVREADLAAWKRYGKEAQDYVARLKPINGADGSEEPSAVAEPAPLPDSAKPVHSQSLKKWFKDVRVPSLEGKPTPRYQDCLIAAQSHFAPRPVSRHTLLEARRESAPASWNKRGRRGSN
jgi:hypothetical protein